ncbi:MAG: hypothetical protein WC533_00845 [Candidatus Pacearchaeota archaeon]
MATIPEPCETRKKALVGLHYAPIKPFIGRALKRFGYEVDIVSSPDDMIDKTTGTEYDFYLMEANLGTPGGTDITPSLTIYKLVEERVKSRKAKFLAVSGNYQTVDIAKRNGIPARPSGDVFMNLFDSLSKILSD